MRVLTRGEILASRSTRQIIQNELINKHQSNLISMTMNIPGQVKNNEEIAKAFARAFYGLMEVVKFERFKIYHVELSNKSTGPVGYMAVDGDPLDLKKLVVLYEEKMTIGRLLDIDILSKKNELISRRDLGIEPRQCFLCDMPSNVCRRTSAHSDEELLEYVNEKLKKYNTWKR